MAQKRISNRALAKKLGRHETSVARLKAPDIMPRLDGRDLESLCQTLNCLPSDLFSIEEGEGL